VRRGLRVVELSEVAAQMARCRRSGYRSWREGVIEFSCMACSGDWLAARRAQVYFEAFVELYIVAASAGTGGKFSAVDSGVRM